MNQAANSSIIQIYRLLISRRDRRLRQEKRQQQDQEQQRDEQQ